MTSVTLVSLKRTSLGWAALAILGSVAAIQSHPLLESETVRAGLTASLVSDLEDYLTYAIGAFGLFWITLHRFMAKRQIARHRWPRPSQVGRELTFSIASQFVFTAVALYLVVGTQQIMAHIDNAPTALGWVWQACLIVLLLAIEDVSFYWTHRAMHHPRLFRLFHRVHHESHDPTPFTAFSFHPLEAIVQSLNSLPVLIPLLFLPWNPVTLAVFAVAQIAFNIIGHLGYELYPANWNRLPLLRWKTPALHHYLHHQMVRGNYALYFRWWDKWCGTECANFEARYDRIFTATSAQSRTELHTTSIKA